MTKALKGMFLLMASAVFSMSVSIAAKAEEVTLRLHHFLPPQAPVPRDFIAPWAQKIHDESDGRINIELYPAMQLGGSPPQLFDQARDGVADIVWTAPGYTPGRFPGSEVMELPFMPASAEATSQAAWEVYERFLVDEFDEVHVIAMHTHGPGLLHIRTGSVQQLEDMAGLTLRGPTRQANALLAALGANPVGMPVPSMPEALSRGVIDGTVIPWEVTAPLRVAELVESHTDFTGERGLYTTMFVVAMNKDRYESLPDDLKSVIDSNSGLETARWIGRVMDEGDDPGRAIAEQAGNAIHMLDENEVMRWIEAADPIAQAWIDEVTALGYDGAEMLEFARDAVERHAQE